uniref:Uncharacterized protein n=1 Tax=Octopus bimaculoides TaxID=37653 RepID=A0A0L8HHP3_OCTBM
MFSVSTNLVLSIYIYLHLLYVNFFLYKINKFLLITCIIKIAIFYYSPHFLDLFTKIYSSLFMYHLSDGKSPFEWLNFCRLLFLRE